MKKLYHITATANVDSILSNGLRGTTEPRNRGERLAEPSIFVLVTDDVNVCNYVAVNQIWVFEDIGDYAVIEIARKGIRGIIRPDLVAERSAPLHRRIEQQVIAPKYLRLRRVEKIGFPGKKILELQSSLCRRKWTKEEWAICRRWADTAYGEAQRMFEAGQLQRSEIDKAA
jgi:hypothetical protein